MIVFWVYFWVCLTVLVGVIASSKGRNGFGWFLLSIPVPPVVTLVAVCAMPAVHRTETSSDKPSSKLVKELREHPQLPPPAGDQDASSSAPGWAYRPVDKRVAAVILLLATLVFLAVAGWRSDVHGLLVGQDPGDDGAGPKALIGVPDEGALPRGGQRGRTASDSPEGGLVEQSASMAPLVFEGCDRYMVQLYGGDCSEWMTRIVKRDGVYYMDGERMEELRHRNVRPGGVSLAMVTRIGEPDMYFVVRDKGKRLDIYVDCEFGPCKYKRFVAGRDAVSFHRGGGSSVGQDHDVFPRLRAGASLKRHEGQPRPSPSDLAFPACGLPDPSRER